MTMTLKANSQDNIEYEPDYPNGLWEWLMFDVGVGSAIGLRQHETEKHKFYYQPDDNGNCPMFNDGFKVSSTDAVAMGKIAIAMAYRFPDKEDVIERFIEFCFKCGGFEIY